MINNAMTSSAATEILIKELRDYRHLHTNFSAGLSLVKECIDLTHITKDSHSVIITGDSGLGKTSIAEEILGTRDLDSLTTNTEESDMGTFLTVEGIFVRVPADCSPRALKRAMLKRLGVKDPKGTVSDLNEMLITLLITSKVRVIIIDEVQQLLNKGSQKTHNQIRDWIKQLTDQTKIPIILIGMPESYKLLQQDNQLLRRFPHHVIFNNFSYDMEKESDFRRLLKGHYDKIMQITPINQLQKFYSSEMSMRLYAMTEGNICALMKYLNIEVVAKALRQGKTSISDSDFFLPNPTLKLRDSNVLRPEEAGSLTIGEIDSFCRQVNDREKRRQKKYA